MAHSLSEYISRRQQLLSDRFHFCQAIRAARRQDEQKMYYHLGQMVFGRFEPRQIVSHPELRLYKKGLRRVYLLDHRP